MYDPLPPLTSKPMRRNLCESLQFRLSALQAGVWPPNWAVIQAKVAVYTTPELPKTPPSYQQASQNLSNWKPRLDAILSSPSKAQFSQTFAQVQVELIESNLLQTEYAQIAAHVIEQKKRKTRSRKSIQKGGVLSVQEARVLQAKKQAADLALIQKRENRAYKRLQVVERNA